MSDEITAYRARWIFPVISPPIENGVVAVRGDKIIEIVPESRWHGPKPLDLFGEVAIVPSFVNAHTHLELSTRRKPIGYSGIPFTDWLNEVIDYRRSNSEYDSERGVLHGLIESDYKDTFLLGDISDSDYVFTFSQHPRIKIVSFYESIGLSEQQCEQRITESKQHLTSAPSSITAGLSPHAPYTVRWNLFEELIQLAVTHQAPVAMHLAESLEEIELLRNRSGPFRTLLEKLGVWREDAWPDNISIADYLQLLAKAPRSLIVHGNYLTTSDIELISKYRDRMSVIYCPRTHAYFEHTPHPYPALIKAGVNVALGTDSRASNPDLSIWQEMRAVAREGKIAPSEILKMGTINGSMALGCGKEYGTIQLGKYFTCMHMVGSNESIDWHSDDPHEDLFS